MNRYTVYADDGRIFAGEWAKTAWQAMKQVERRYPARITCVSARREP